MIRFFHSVLYFTFLFLRKQHFDVVFYAPAYFNRGYKGENLYFKNLIDSCRKHNLSYIVFEEPSGYQHIRNDKSIPFDFIFYFIVILRRLMKVENDIIQTENNIGDFLSNTFFYNFRYNNYIVLSKSMISIFSRIDKKANIFDLQHGIIYRNKPDYFSDNILSPHLKRNNVSLLLNGRLFKQILIEHGDKEFVEDNAHIIGVQTDDCILHHYANRNILVTLQFTGDHTDIQNHKLLKELISVIDSHKDFSFFLRNHPRFNNEVKLDEIYKHNNVFVAPNLLENCFKKCSIHLTSYSTTTFECAIYGIPTVFLKSVEDDFNMFFLDYNLRKRKSISFVYSNYNQESAFFRDWVDGYYSKYDEDKFINLLR